MLNPQNLMIVGFSGVIVCAAIALAGVVWKERQPSNVLTIQQFDWMNSHVPDWRERFARGESIIIPPLAK